MADPPAPRAAPPFRRRLYVRIFAALLASITVAAVLFALVHVRYMHHGLSIALVAIWTAIALGVAIGAYPVVRRLTRRLEHLQASVEAWGKGDLSTRVEVDGDDEITRLAASFNVAAARIEALVAAQKNLLANASHELRSPLARIRMAVELVQDRASPEVRDELARNIAELDQLIDEVLLASRLDAFAEAEDTPVPFDLTALVAEESARAGAALAAPPISIEGEPRLIRRLVRNLLENASRYDRNGPVEVDLAIDAGSVRLRVCDSGPGVPEAERELIFTPFYRVRGANEGDGGVGLGLSLVRQIARRHGGEVVCLSRATGGCCFEVVLPERA